jgi:ribosomal protein S18 acetylase RimI-like enzyme
MTAEAARRYTLRQGSAEDFAFVWWLQATTMRPLVEQIWGWDEATQRNLFRARFDGASRQIIVVEGRDAGVLEVERRPDTLEIATLQIAFEVQSHGIGAAVLRDLIAEARAQRQPATLQVFQINTRARALYERLGFVEYGRSETHILMRCDPPARG